LYESTRTSKGTFDVTILTMEDGLFEVKAVAGNGHLGEILAY
jgi:molecular chaperone DnaK (HSP70)